MNLLTIFLGMIGPWQIAIVVALVLLLFGGRKIPELMRGLGTGIKEFKDATKNEDEEKTDKVEDKK
ncbi:Sec-independent protein translocase subunit TatA/TatB [Tenacibaculum larymnensis]|uniref:Sec-independent protein translocase protein TatA n=1 Tax=Tenacibaculum larymnensis TaxID=2878201 RepID=A0A9X4EP02_9FLAO|nr:twin-arginine translocase TatA/TatE family subunit [Tenacibaculum larymnensis]MDE1205485.1 twin-arginine translocase TatA/TatE family subunit [Tenacibaculum larymnensis]